MLLGNDYKIKVKISIDNEIKVLKYNFNTLRNLYGCLNKSPFEFNQEFISVEYDVEKITILIYCMLNAEIDFNKLDLIVVAQGKQLYENLKKIIVLEMTSDNDEISSGDSDSDSDKNKLFEDYYNFFYYVSRSQLHMKEEEFLNCSPREIKTMYNYDKAYKKSILLGLYGNKHSDEENVLDVDKVGIDTIFNLI